MRSKEMLRATSPYLSGVVIIVMVLFLHVSMAARPHIVIILADDLGFDDVGYRSKAMYTPNIDKMAKEGVKLKYAYMQQVCTPSRAAFMTGIYPFRMGLQNSVLSALENRSMPMDKTVLSQRLKTLRYATHYVGKWHLGFCNYNMTPTYRGFDTFYGMYTGKEDYYTHISKWNGYDFHDDNGQNFNVDWTAKGKYSTPLFTERAVKIIEGHDTRKPLFLFLAYQAVHGPEQVPDDYLKYCADVTNETRKTHCAMAAAMDEGIGKVNEALEKRNMTDNLITLFLSDNGGAVKKGSSNWPLRGAKLTLWEGGTRVAGILHSKSRLPDAPYEYKGLIHAVDWYPTLMRAAGDRDGVSGIDGVDSWKSIVKNWDTSSRDCFVYNIDDVKNTSAVRCDQYKLVHNKAGSPDGWWNWPNGTTVVLPKGRYPEYMLFDIENDPSEMIDLGGNSSFTDTIEKLKAELKKQKDLGFKPSKPAPKPGVGKPKFHNGTWVSGWC